MPRTRDEPKKGARAVSRASRRDRRARRPSTAGATRGARRAPRRGFAPSFASTAARGCGSVVTSPPFWTSLFRARATIRVSTSQKPKNKNVPLWALATSALPLARVRRARERGPLRVSHRASGAWRVPRTARRVGQATVPGSRASSGFGRELRAPVLGATRDESVRHRCASPPHPGAARRAREEEVRGRRVNVSRKSPEVSVDDPELACKATPLAASARSSFFPLARANRRDDTPPRSLLCLRTTLNFASISTNAQTDGSGRRREPPGARRARARARSRHGRLAGSRRLGNERPVPSR